MASHSAKRALSELDGEDSSELAPPRKKSKFNGLDDDDINSSNNDENISNNQIKKRLSMSGKPICLNVGGIKHATTLNTLSLYEHTFFNKMFSGSFSLKPSDDGSYFIDRNGKYFYIILDFLRNKTLNIPNSDRCFIIKHLLQESEFYNIKPLIIALQTMYSVSSILSTKQVQQINKMINPEMVRPNQCEWKLLYQYNVCLSNQATKMDSLYQDILSVVAGQRSILIVTEQKGETAVVYIKNKVHPVATNDGHSEHIDISNRINTKGFYFESNAELKKTEIAHISITGHVLSVAALTEDYGYRRFICSSREDCIQPKGVEIFQV